jgi:predicted NAD/FAD-dependent oxidoreductase
VDTSCIVPMPLVGQAYTRAYAFRDATEGIRAARVGRSWTDVATDRPAFVPPDLPFEPVDLATTNLAELVASCAIDHGVPPVRDTPGGSVAGYARWGAFISSGRLARYAADRNDPLRHGVSRMSAYLHYGMVSPMRLVRECVALGGEGPEKYLDELLVWREVAYAFCFWHEDPTSLDAIPAWARETLARHARDPRPRPTWERLSRAQSGDALWDAAQCSLLRQGELHNNVRMTWGKALVGWTRDAEEALDLLVDLNHRYALDGRDPASYGGLLWCLGQFDRPFTPELPVIGTVRPRPTREHARRLDVTRYAAHVNRTGSAATRRVLVIGAGIAGLACARTLHDQGMSVTVVDKGRGVGGRLATRREGDWRFDHGAPQLQLTDERAARFLASWCEAGVLSPRSAGYLGSSAMNALPKHLAQDLAVTTGVEVQAMRRTGPMWQVTSTDGRQMEAEVLLLATPAPQAATLLRTIDDGPSSALAARLDAVQMAPCWSTMLVFDAPPPMAFVEQLTGGEIQLRDERIARCIRECDKPGRPPSECWTIQSSAPWSAAHLERSAEEIAQEIAAVFREQSGIVGGLLHARAHRWRYARAAHGLPESCLYTPELQLGACGDFAQGDATSHADVEAAWLSGVALAGRVLAR